MQAEIIEGLNERKQVYEVHCLSDIYPGQTVYIPTDSFLGIRKEKVLGISVHVSSAKEPDITVINEQGDKLDNKKIFTTREQAKDYLKNCIERI